MEETSRKDKPSGKKKMLNEILSWLGSLVMALVIVMLLRTLVFTLIRVDGASMKNTLLSDDRVYVSVLTPRIAGYERGDIVICTYPGEDHQCVKRILGLPGETVEIKDGVTYVDGVAREEEYVDHAAWADYGPYTVPEGKVFVMGDNRADSRDSRNVGALDEDMIVGKVRCIWWPLDRIGLVD